MRPAVRHTSHDEHGHRRTSFAWPSERFVGQRWHGLYFDGGCG
jgi:hypothetical protein